DMFFEHAQSLVGICKDVDSLSSQVLTLDLTKYADVLPEVEAEAEEGVLSPAGLPASHSNSGGRRGSGSGGSGGGGGDRDSGGRGGGGGGVEGGLLGKRKKGKGSKGVGRQAREVQEVIAEETLEEAEADEDYE
ncbi:hypothetical protein B484DRAFT_438930, partial [Ochromonadaceae sp. CCMP2298]